MKTLQYLYSENFYHTDKGTKHTYLETYDELFNPLKEKKINLLEIWINIGGSLKLFYDYFSSGNIYGIDIIDIRKRLKPDYKGKNKGINKSINFFLNNDKINLKFFDCNNKNLVDQNFSENFFDLIIDDASHDIYYQINTFNLFKSKLKKNGYYIFEDVGAGKRDIWHILYPNRNRKSKNVRLPTFNLTQEEKNKYINCSDEFRNEALTNYTEKSIKYILDNVDKNEF